MPPRWILFAVIAVYTGSWIKLTIANELLNTLPVASNGWRPIVGTSKVKPYHTIDQTVDQAPKQTISLTSEQEKDKNKNNNKNQVPSKLNGPVLINHHGSTGHHGVKPTKPVGVKLVGPVKSSGKPGVVLTKASPAPRHPVLGKLHAHLNHAKRHKPPQIRDEIMAPAPSSAIGSYAYYNQGPLLKPFPQGQVDFSNHFAFSNLHNDVILPQQPPLPQPFYKHPSQNELHPVPVLYQDEYTRNLVPPPPHYKPQGETESVNVEPTIQLHKYRQPEGYYQIGSPGFDLEITKEKFKEYHTTLAPSSFKTSTESFLETSKYTKPKLIASSLSGYEVTEDKEWTEQFPQYKPLFPTAKPKYAQIPQYYQHDDSINAQFLPTPYNPEQAFPTSPTQAEVSSVYSEVSKKKVKVPTTTVYNIKEVATHFPIYTNKYPAPTQIPLTPSQLPIIPSVPSVPTQLSSIPLQSHHEVDKEVELVTEVTTPREETEPTSRTTERTYPTRYSQSQRRPTHRRRRPTRPPTTTTTEQLYNTEESVQTVETERPKTHRRRRPIKYRTTESSREPIETTTRTIYRPRPTRVQPQTITEEVFVSKNHRHRPSYPQPIEDTITEGVFVSKNHRHRPSYPQPTEDTITEEVFVSKNHRHRPSYLQPTEETITEAEIERDPTREQEEPESTSEVEYIQNPSTETENYDEPTEMIKKRKRIRIITTTESLPVTNLNISESYIPSENVPENELDYTTLSSEPEEIVTIKDIYDFETEGEPTTITTTTTTTSTTPEPTTTKTNRLRRPIKYDVQRPRFSVKDYRQRLNQYISSTTESVKQSTESTPRIRYPSRFNKLSTITEAEETTEPIRQKFMPKEPRHKISFNTENTEPSSTEKYIRTKNTRLKQLTRFRTSTEPSSTTTTQKVSIKPNIFNNLKRPQQLSLRNRIYNKRNFTTTTEIITEPTIPTEETSEKNEVTIPFEIAESKIEVTTQIYREPTTESTKIDAINMKEEDDAFLQLQRISDLTSSAHKQYNTPGMFKSVSPTSRKVPSYFTIATEDPILPIEAFFPNLNQKV